MLTNTLNTNEIKDSTGAEVEFERLSTGPGAVTIFKKIAETPGIPHRLTISHASSGSGKATVRRSLVRFDCDYANQTTYEKMTFSAYVVVVVPEGMSDTLTIPKNVLANLMSFLATTGSGTTVLFDCTGTGAQALINGNI